MLRQTEDARLSYPLAGANSEKVESGLEGVRESSGGARGSLMEQ